ncbi:MAG: hypothetical protein Ct9H300mP1_23020 [Planctomycetaceae bacterium]|nr:MAG: hypothetical protein Ct9H300mP1_23020 [Planctomycetaceae bacterium]
MESWFPSPAARRENCSEKIGTEFDGCALFPFFVFGGLLLLAGFGFFWKPISAPSDGFSEGVSRCLEPLWFTSQFP